MITYEKNININFFVNKFKCYGSRYLQINGTDTGHDANVAVAGIAIMLAMEITS